MAVTINPYLNFRGQARAAIDFYQSVFGGEVHASTFGEAGMPVDASETDWIMHSQLETPNGIVVMCSDAPSHMGTGPLHNGAISISGPAEDEAVITEYWNKLADGASITAPFARAPWGDLFGMLDDKYGVSWLVDVGAPAE